MRRNLFLLVLAFFFCGVSFSQEISTLFKANSFSEAYYNPAYQELKLRKENGQTLTEKEEQWLNLYKQYLNSYLELLNKNQRSIFAEQRNALILSKDSIHTKANGTAANPVVSEALVKERNTQLLLGHIAFSGVSGIIYGIQANYIFDIESTTSRIGLPMLISGGSMLVPVFSEKYDDINSNSLWLRAHGKLMGGLYGYFFNAALFGDKIFDSYNYESYNEYTGEYKHDRQMKPVALTTSLISSVALGQLGFHFGKTKDWTDGRIATYQYYSYALPAVSALTYLSLSESEDIQGYGAIVSATVPLGYFIAHSLSDRIPYTRGDMTAIINNTAIGGMLGASIAIYSDFSTSKALLWPIGGAVLGSAFGHYTYRDFHITRPEGRRLNYAAIGGGLIGLGTTFLMDADEAGTYMVIPAIFGAAGYGLLLNHYKNQPRFTRKENNDQRAFNFQLHPENYFLNKQLPKDMQAPLFSLRATF